MVDEHQRQNWTQTSERDPVNRKDEILEELGDVYWRKDYEGSGRIFTAVVRTILSQNQQDSVSGPAADRLTDRFGREQEMLDGLLEASSDSLAEIIHPCGPHHQKASFILNWTEFVDSEFGEIDNLNWFVDRRPVDRVREKLTEPSGVGRKTIDVVLTFVAGKDGVFAVDTHVHRVAQRTAMVPEYASRTDTADILSQYVPDDKCGWGHSCLISHGKKVCGAQSPDCQSCPIEDRCPQIGVDND